MKKEVLVMLRKRICFTMAILCIVMLTFTLVEVRTDYTMSNNYAVLDNGFSMLSFTSFYLVGESSWLATVIGLCSIFQLIAGVVAIGLSLVGYKSKKLGNSEIAIIIITAISTVLYMVEGILFRGQIIADLNVATYNVQRIKTYAYFPVIIAVLLLGGYILVSILEEKKGKENYPAVKGNVAEEKKESLESKKAPIYESKKEIKNLDDKVKVIKQYKELLDVGAITQEEFDAIKKNILL